ncbi:MAG TPA: ABC transporter ATP-binding protein [Solirubrobacteraceae bacterium]|jgi:ABC-type polysaccharide/polyol phosphate transport system ATPase subunit|nr:ABC transporter ATP-binding protein [Solirubrobacteraceae bacterium]
MPQLPSHSTPPIVARSVSKTFRVPEERTHTLKETALHPLRRSSHQSFSALSDISFEVHRGEFFGIAGRNGSGKSTLLKCLAGIYGVDQGQIWMDGRLSTFIELGVGFNQDLAARDNVVLNGIMMGLTPREARRRVDEVIDFAELREFEELKLKNYSSGMHVRLAFSVAIQVDADILLVDEVLAVGDAAFQQKCFDVFYKMRDENRTIVFVTHDMGSLNRFCHRALLLERGETVLLGEPHEVADRYLEINFGREATPSGDAEGEDRGGDGDARVLEAWIEDEHGQRPASLPQGQPIVLKALVRFEVEVEDPVASLYVLNEDHLAIVVATSSKAGESSGSFRAGEEVLCSFAFDNVLAPGRYNPLFTLAHRGTGLDLIDRYEGAFSFVVTGPEALGGAVDLPVRVAMSRSQAGSRERVP